MVVGGYNDVDGYGLSSVVTLLPGAAAWTPLASLPRGLSGARASIVGGRIRIIGGLLDVSFRSEVMIEKW